MIDPELRLSRAAAYETARPEILAAVPLGASKILDLGCSSGALGAAIKARQAAFVLGVEIHATYADEAAAIVDRVECASVEEFLDRGAPLEGPFDCVVAADVLEHLVDPWAALKRASALVSPGGTVIVSVPNVLFWPALLRAMRTKRWPRDDAGIFDRTHLRWFSESDVVDLVEGAGLTVAELRPLVYGHRWGGRLKRALLHTPLREFQMGQHLVLARQSRSVERQAHP